MPFLKHVDFEVAHWGEFASGPAGSGSVTLSQASQAAFPDRPASEGCGLLAAMTAGVGQRFLEHALPAARAMVHARLLVNLTDAAGGALTILAMLDGAATQVLGISLDASAGQVVVTLADEQQLAGNLCTELSWHCIEVRIDVAGGQAVLWIDGVQVDAVAGATAPLMATMRVGVIDKHVDAIGSIHLDEVVLADSYIGPVIVQPSTDHADAPERWLVVYNSADNESAAWAEDYRDARRVPFANLLGLELSLDEEVDAAAYEQLNVAIESYLALNGLGGQVMGVLLGYNVPGYVALAGGGRLPIAALLQSPAETAESGAVTNPVGTSALVRPTNSHLGAIRLTARIDAPTLDDARALTDRATTVIEMGTGDDLAGTIWLDPLTSPGPETDAAIAAMTSWSAGIDRMRTNLPLRITTSLADEFDQINRDGFYWGWSSAQPPAGYFSTPAGSRIFSFQLHHESATAPTLRDAQPTEWLGSAFAVGYAAGAGSSGPYNPGIQPSIARFFEALRRGWTLAEAWLVANPSLRTTLFLAGDPLMSVPMPKSGWSIFGPMRKLESLRTEEPALTQPAGERETALTDRQWPASEDAVLYVIRRSDALGRAEAGTRSLRTARVDGQFVTPPLAPIWPRENNWPVSAIGGSLRPTIAWERRIAAAHLRSIELLTRVGDGPITAQQADFQPAVRSAQIDFGPGQAGLRFAWRLTGSDGGVLQSPWSAPAPSAASPTTTLRVVEVLS